MKQHKGAVEDWGKGMVVVCTGDYFDFPWWKKALSTIPYYWAYLHAFWALADGPLHHDEGTWSRRGYAGFVLSLKQNEARPIWWEHRKVGTASDKDSISAPHA